MGEGEKRNNILWLKKALKKRRENTKKGVDKGLAVWYISKALDRELAGKAGAAKKICGAAKKVLTTLWRVW